MVCNCNGMYSIFGHTQVGCKHWYLGIRAWACGSKLVKIHSIKRGAWMILQSIFILSNLYHLPVTRWNHLFSSVARHWSAWETCLVGTFQIRRFSAFSLLVFMYYTYLVPNLPQMKTFCIQTPWFLCQFYPLYLLPATMPCEFAVCTQV